jgi:hypothetical protein
VKRSTFVITVLAVLATAGSVFIGTRAIVGTAASLRNGGATARAASAADMQAGAEVAALIADLEGPEYPDWAAGHKRDPLVPYRAPAPPRPSTTTTPTPPEPPPPSYEVRAVFLDEDPTAVLWIGGRTVTVRVGESVNGERVIAIDAGGVTIEGEAGARRFAYSPSN